jgi:hypothetical protein
MLASYSGLWLDLFCFHFRVFNFHFYILCIHFLSCSHLDSILAFTEVVLIQGDSSLVGKYP